MPLIYRSMRADGDQLMLGCSATSLGVRVPPSKDPDLPVEPDGTVFKAGDFVSYPPGSRHHSHSPDGCLLLVFLRAYNRRLAPGEREEDAAA